MNIGDSQQSGAGARLKLVAIWLVPFIAIVPVAVAQPEHQTPATYQASLPDSPLVRDAHFHSVSLNREMSYRIYLPQNYPASTRPYPVLYLLHGLYGGYKNWDTLTKLEKYSAGANWIIVMPDADDSWYTNSVTKPQDKFEDYVAKDVVAEIENKYRTIKDRQARAIAGLSMGGYAAMKLAIRESQAFAFAGSLSGALDAGRDLDSRRPEFAAKLIEVFGPPGNPARQKNDVFQLLRSAEPKELPYLYLACGAQDSFLSVNREFVAQISHLGVRYEYHETPGEHDWAYWDRAISLMLITLKSFYSAK